jgi:hypothetical protein
MTFAAITLTGGIACAVAAWVFASVLTALYAGAKNYSIVAIFIATLFIGFPVVVLVLAIAPDRTLAQALSPAGPEVERSTTVPRPA